MNDEVSTLRDSGALLGERRPAPITGDRYRLGGVIGAGGMGEVIAARDLQIGRDVAIKRMKAKDPTDAQIARFEREAQIQGRLEHPAIVPVHEAGRDTDGRPYFVMKKLAGRTLGELMEEKPAPRARMLRAFIDVCLAVELAHTRGIVHRDLKPDNIVLGDFGEVYVLDWGVARVVGEQSDIASISADDHAASSGPMTVAGAAVGTPGYMPPEQIQGDPKLDARADVYALGCVLFEILAGESLHPRGPAGMMSASHGLADLSPARRAPDGEVPPELDALCIRATALAPGDRIATARELGDRVQHYLDGDRDVAARRTLAVRHHAEAVQALERGDEGQPIALREAGRALALDPTLAPAADLVTRLMLEPPREVPPEVHVEMEAEEHRGLASFARMAVPTFLAYLVIVPSLVMRTPPLEAAVVIAAVLAIVGILYMIGKLRARVSLLLWTGTGMLAVLTHLLSPVVVMPLVVVNGMVLAALMPGKPARVQITLAMGLAISVPWLCETAGILPSTFAIDAAGGHLFPPILLGDPAYTVAFFIGSVAAIIGSAVLIGDALRRQHASARLALHLQAWRLRQLAPL